MGSNQENQDSLSCFQENQEIESWPNFAVRRDFKNQENQDFKSWKSWSKKLNLATKAYWISVRVLTSQFWERTDYNPKFLKTRPNKMFQAQS